MFLSIHLKHFRGEIEIENTHTTNDNWVLIQILVALSLVVYLRSEETKQTLYKIEVDIA
jgi:hypothetical protein